tara:strand:+ start:672 stop:998 length:327 start_codon:yes stop_codon:yes gene_type:complete
MKRPGTLEVADKLRELKLFNCELNNIDVKKWSDKHYQEWDCILNGITYIPKENKYVKNGNSNRIQILRVADGKIYESITQCINHNGFYKEEMVALLKQSKHYKKIIKT